MRILLYENLIVYILPTVSIQNICYFEVNEFLHPVFIIFIKGEENSWKKEQLNIFSLNQQLVYKNQQHLSANVKIKRSITSLWAYGGVILVTFQWYTSWMIFFFSCTCKGCNKGRNQKWFFFSLKNVVYFKYFKVK